ncbi:hypothetical protein WG904_16235 [Pedobacter sp. Du54]|uniref:hypothetical protein n=1 Tax=Pedobacter anseongensis TaxID=3133439 RepID=UPI0030A0DF6F
MRLRIKFLKYILFILVTGSAEASFAHYGTSGYGCNLGNVVYGQKIGTTKFYGTSYDVYSSNGAHYSIDWNNASTPYQINSYNIHDQGETCWVNSYVNPKNNNSGVSYGSLVYYTVNPQVNVPLDDYVGLILILTSGLGAIIIYKKQLLSSKL